MGGRVDRDRAPLSTARPRWLRPALLAVPAGFLALFYVWPVATLLGEVTGGTTVADTLSRPGIAAIVWFTAWQAVVSTLATLVVGLGPAHLLARWDFPARRAIGALVVVPFLLPTVVVGAAFTTLLPERLEGTAAAVILAHVFFNIAVVVRVVGAVWAQLPHDLVGAARTLGATPWQAARAVTLPLLRPALAAAATVVFLFTFTSFGVVQILGGPRNPTIEVEIARRATQLGDVAGAAVLSALQLAILAVLLGAASAVRRRPTELGLAPVRRSRPDTRRRRWWVATGALATVAVTLVPLGALVVGSLRPGAQWSLVAWRTLGDTEVRPGVSTAVDPIGAIAASVRSAVAATAVSLVVGTLAALAIAAARSRGRLLDLGMMLPLGTSAVTIGFGMLITFDHAPFDWRGEPWLVPLGHALVASPFVVRTLLPVLRSRPESWLEAAATLGASPLRAWWAIDVPMLRRPLVVAAAMAAAISLGEFGATTFLTRSGHETLPIAIARLLGRAGDVPRAQAAALALLLAVVTTVILLAVDAVERDPTGGERGARRP